MLSTSLSLCLFFALCSTGSSLRCKGMRHTLRRLSETTMDLVDSMASNSTDIRDGDEADTVGFPRGLYKQALNGSAKDKIDFAVQVLEEVGVLFEENHSSASWDKVTVENFRMAVTRQAEELSKCTHSHKRSKVNQELRVYFKNLSSHVLHRKGHSAEAWEVIRKHISRHLPRIDLLLSPLFSAQN